MTAKEMFKDLGYVEIPTQYDDQVIRYYNSMYRRELIFWKDDDGNLIGSPKFDISMELLKAINQQCKELGWLSRRDYEPFEPWLRDIDANNTIEEALLNLDCWIDNCREDGSTYNAIGWWNMLETFRKCKDDLELYNKALDWITRGIFSGKNLDGKLFYKRFPLVSPEWLKNTALIEARKELDEEEN